MAVQLSKETGSLIVMVFFVAAYLMFSNNYHFSEHKPTTIDKVFNSVAHESLQNAVDGANSNFGNRARQQPPAAALADSKGAARGGGKESFAVVVKQHLEDAAKVWPPKLSIHLGDKSLAPTPLLGQPENGCIYQQLGGQKWRYCLPSLLTISCINCGTTSLGAYLDSHKYLSVGTKKEHKFFVMKCADEKQGVAYECDTKSYQLEFPSLPAGCAWDEISGQASGMKRDFDTPFSSMHCDGQQRSEMVASVENDDWAPVFGLDISPKYFFVQGAARRVHKMMPHARMIALLRNPVDRHLSHIETKAQMQLGAGRRGGMRGGGGGRSAVTLEHFSSCVDAVADKWGLETTGEGAGPQGCTAEQLQKMETFMTEEKSYSHYIKHFRVWFDLFGRDRFLFIADTTLHDPDIRQQLMDEISAFAGVPSYQYPADSPLYNDKDTAHASSKKWAISNKLRQVLWNIFDLDKHNAELYEELGHDFGWTATK